MTGKTLVAGALVGVAGLFMGQEKELTVKDVTDHIQQRYEMIDDATAEFEQDV
jgi:hypothetical protein